ncbi:eukaryotic translation initiation factor 5B isoform X2 [Diachasmimorpha longicaudata]|uniref:eukaryotic translation initiation factor 5B isoform X2 n=1 Tax=Diachasmimorpha longicaudata TaxID=58733 RepID=UPI0030B8DA06
MGKPKRGKRTGKDDDFDSDVGVDEWSNADSTQDKSKLKDKRSKKSDDFDDLTSELEKMKVDKMKGKKGKKSRRGDDDDESITKGKSKKQDESDSESENKSKLKSKKGKKTAGGDDFEQEINLKSKGKKEKSSLVDYEDDSGSEYERKGPAKGKLKQGKRDNNHDDDDEFLDKTSEGNSLKSKNKGKTRKGRKGSIPHGDDDDDVAVESSKFKPQAAKGGFALLNVEGDYDIDCDTEEPPQSDDATEPIPSVEQSASKSKQQRKEEPQGKKGKKKKKKQDSDDELEKALAELEIEYSGKKPDKQENLAPVQDVHDVGEDKGKRGRKDKVKDQEKKSESELGDDGIVPEDGSTVKTAAQKKKEKKEREKLKKIAQKKAEAGKQEDDAPKASWMEMPLEKNLEPIKKSEDLGEVGGDMEESKKKKKKASKEDPKDKGKGPGRKMIAAMQQALKKAKEEEERVQQEEEERIRQEELKEKARLEQLQLEQERKEKKKLKEKQRKERLKAEGKLLTTKQKQDRARAQAMLEALKAQGMEIPEAGEKKPKMKLGTRIRPSKIKQQVSTEEKEDEKKDERRPEQIKLEIVDNQKGDKKEEDEVVKDSWDAVSSEDELEDQSEEAGKPEGSQQVNKLPDELEKKESSESESESGSETESESEEESEEGSVDDRLTDAERKKEKAKMRIQNRRMEAEKNKTIDNLRAAVVCVLGHVDTGKTKILDKLRRTNVQDGEAGGITQQIGATNVPIEAIHESTKHVKGYGDKTFKIPGLLIIDTPGHESFSNLRNRGSSLCDIAVLVVDIMHGLEPQTLESIGLLKAKKCPFVVALNKIDRLYDWQTMNRKDVQDIIKTQGPNTQREFEKRSQDVIVQFAEQGLNAALFYENPDPRSYVSLVPTSAITGEGMGNLLALIIDACQGPLAKRLMYSEELQATVLEVKALPGLGTTIDCILVNGTLKEGETMIVAGTDGPIVTQIRSLLMPQPLKELRVKNAYQEYREVRAAQGVKIAAKDLEKAIAGLNLAVAQKADEVEIMREEIAKELSKALGNIKLAERGVFVQASTLGALEALLDFLTSSKIPFSRIQLIGSTQRTFVIAIQPVAIRLFLYVWFYTG